MFLLATDEPSIVPGRQVTWTLWRSDGTDAGTVLVKELLFRLPPVPQVSLFASRNKLFFLVNRFELWTSDGTVDGTLLLKTFTTSSRFHGPSSFTSLGDLVLFSATEEGSGTELWRSDGTDGGTVLLKDIFPGLGSSFPESLTRVGEEVFFAAADEPGGIALLDLNGDGRIDVSDPVYALYFLFGTGPAPTLGTACRPLAGCPRLEGDCRP